MASLYLLEDATYFALQTSSTGYTTANHYSFNACVVFQEFANANSFQAHTNVCAFHDCVAIISFFVRTGDGGASEKIQGTGARPISAFQVIFFAIAKSDIEALLLQ